jgi:hypothetical protein
VEGRRQEVGQVAPPPSGAARGWPMPPYGVAAPGPPPSLLWTPSRVGEIGTLAFVSSNSENISCVAFLKHKNSRKQGTGSVASC